MRSKAASLGLRVRANRSDMESVLAKQAPKGNLVV